MKNKKFIILFVFFICYILPENSQVQAFRINDEQFWEIVEPLSHNNFSASKKKLLFLKFVQKKKRDYDRFTGIIRDFFGTIGVNGDFFNWNDNHILGIIDIDANIDANFIKEHFTGIISDVGIKTGADFAKRDL